MADDLTSKQESVSAKFFDTFINNKWNPTDTQYEKLLSDCFGKSGIYPLGNSKVDVEWRNNFDKQVLALQQYAISRNINSVGWVWSRGDGMMGFLNNIAQQRCGVSGSLDSWNPMDVVGVLGSSENKIRKEINDDIIAGVDPDTNRDLLNSIMIKYITSKELMPVSLKKIKNTEGPAFEISKDLQTRNAKLRSKHNFTYKNFYCDLEWSVYKNEWRTAQEISWDMIDPGNVISTKYEVHVQARAFQGKNPREKPQHSLAAKGAGAMLGKSSITPLDEFVKNVGFRPVPSPSSHRYIPKPGQQWKEMHKSYWRTMYSDLQNATIAGSRINFGTPGAYSEGSNKKILGWNAALDAACQADEKGLLTKKESRSSGSRLSAKLWGLEWLHRYHEIDRAGKWDAFCYQLYKASTKELPGTGPFIKVFGKTGRSIKARMAHIETLPETIIDWDNL